MEVSAGVEPAMRGLQPRALPLGYETVPYTCGAPAAGIEPALPRLTAGCLTAWRRWNEETVPRAGSRTRRPTPFQGNDPSSARRRARVERPLFWLLYH